ncbi:MAG: bacillithiol biosynthesis BshC [Holophagales bacterium]|jgi:hypothetical protein|nr:bacillithiol biosynthesis BshC [Holophagales bacterium]
MGNVKGVVATGQQIGAGWSPALSVVKALAALAESKRRGLQAVYWLADEDHDRMEVASVTAIQGNRLIRHRFEFSAPQGTATGWLEWTSRHQTEAESLWGKLPCPTEPTLRGHAIALGKTLWERGISPYSPTKDADRTAIQGELERWRGLKLEDDLNKQAALLESKGEKLVLDPRTQSAWFSLNPLTGARNRLEAGQPCPKGHWLSPGAALRPLMQSLLLPVEAVVLGPAERAYWKLLESVWHRVGLNAPQILPRPSVFVLEGATPVISVEELEAIKMGEWGAFAPIAQKRPTEMQLPEPDPSWPSPISKRFLSEMRRTKLRLARLDKRLEKEAAGKKVGGDVEKLRQMLFPFNKPQERVLPGWHWLQNDSLLDSIEKALENKESVYLVKV